MRKTLIALLLGSALALAVVVPTNANWLTDLVGLSVPAPTPNPQNPMHHAGPVQTPNPQNPQKFGAGRLYRQ